MIQTEEFEGQSFAAIDLGSNSFHMIVASYEHGRFRVLDRIKDTVRLAEGLGESGLLSTKVKLRAITALTRFGERLRGMPSTHVRAVGTNTLRLMQQSHNFLNTAETALGYPIDVIAGREEARLIYLGVTENLPIVDKPRLIIDIGGGSTELIIGFQGKPKELESLDVGCVVITKKFFPDRRLNKHRWKKAHLAVASELDTIKKWFGKKKWSQAVGSSGTFKSLAQIAHSHNLGDGSSITAHALSMLQDKILKHNKIEQLDLAGLSVSRKPVIVGGLIIAQACCKALDIDEIRVSDYALREGVLYDLLGRRSHHDPREATIRSMATRYHIDTEQADAVRSLAKSFGNSAKKDWQLGNSHIRMLKRSAYIHEIGRSVSHQQYEKHGDYLLENSDMAGFSRIEQQMLGLLVRYHRGKILVDAFSTLPKKTEKVALQLCVLLRLAVLFNRSRKQVSALPVKIKFERKEVTLSFEPGWLDEHPLTEADLEKESRRLSRVGFTLIINTQ
ncbi:MAG: Ppx/GppA phosphatase family protein [bacterium]